MRRKQQPIKFMDWRFKVLAVILILVMLALVARMFYLTVYERKFLLHQANARIMRVVKLPAYRGRILSRNGQTLALSIPADSIWINPRDFPASPENIQQVSQILNVNVSHLKRLIERNKHKYFIYVKRDVKPSVGQKISALALPGLYLKREYQRYYPEGQVTSQLVGFTNIDDQGQSGLELAYNQWLEGVPGEQKVLKDRLGQIVAVIDTVRKTRPGKNLVLSINSKIQFLAFRVLKATVNKYHAQSGSVVVMNPKTGEVLAMVNMPTFDPNKPYGPPYDRYRNRAVTDVYEPGSVMKTFSIASALESGKYTPETLINTSPGWFYIGRNEVKDELDNGLITVTQVLQKSSNVGVAHMTLSLPADHLLNLLQRVGFGERTGSGFPGESAGVLPIKLQWRPFDLATLAFGYGIAVTPLQLTEAYTIIANHGLKCPVTLLKRNKPVQCSQVIKPKIADEMLKMLESVLKPGGTGTLAVIPGYQVAGKTGTAYIAGPHGYNHKKHMSTFVGIAPVSNPRLVVAVVVRDPHAKLDFGGVISAPAFAKIMAGSLRILNVAPDKLDTKPERIIAPYPEDD